MKAMQATKVTISSELDASYDEVWRLVKKSHTLCFVTKGLLGFEADTAFPMEWQQGRTEHVRLKLFSLIPGWKHRIFFETISEQKKEIITKEQGGLVSRWDHTIKVETAPGGKCRYTDEVIIEAGVFTPLVWLSANCLYRYRQRRWHKLLSLKTNSIFT